MLDVIGVAAPSVDARHGEEAEAAAKVAVDEAEVKLALAVDAPPPVLTAAAILSRLIQSEPPPKMCRSRSAAAVVGRSVCRSFSVTDECVGGQSPPSGVVHTRDCWLPACERGAAVVARLATWLVVAGLLRPG